MPNSAAPHATPPQPMYPAFKEWQVIVDALAAGEQSLLLRKGGIAENHGEFDPSHAARFWLFPTQFHAQREKTKPELAHRFSVPSAMASGSVTTNGLIPSSSASAETVTLSAFAEVLHHRFITDWATLAALDPFHGWTEAAVREKFNWGNPPGLHALVVRVHRLDQPITLTRTATMAGCTSWIELAVGFDEQSSIPVEPKRALAQVMALLAG